MRLSPPPSLDRAFLALLPASKTLRNLAALPAMTAGNAVKAGFAALPGTFAGFPRIIRVSAPKAAQSRRGAGRCGSHAGWRRRPEPPPAMLVEKPLQALEPGPVGLARDRHQQRRQGAQAHLARRRGQRRGVQQHAVAVRLGTARASTASVTSSSASRARARWAAASAMRGGDRPGRFQRRHQRADADRGRSAPRCSSGSSSQAWPARFEIVRAALARAMRQQRPRHDRSSAKPGKRKGRQRPHRRKPVQPAAARQPQQEGLGLIVRVWPT